MRTGGPPVSGHDKAPGTKLVPGASVRFALPAGGERVVAAVRCLLYRWAANEVSPETHPVKEGLGPRGLWPRGRRGPANGRPGAHPQADSANGRRRTLGGRVPEPGRRTQECPRNQTGPGGFAVRCCCTGGRRTKWRRRCTPVKEGLGPRGLRPRGRRGPATGRPGAHPQADSANSRRRTLGGRVPEPGRWTRKSPRNHNGPEGFAFMPAEAEGLEPPRACARRISSAVPYQLGLRLQTSDEPGPGRPSRLIKPTIGAPGFEPGTSATRTQRSTGLSHAPRTQPHPPRVCAPERTGWDSNPRGCLAPHDFQSCALSRSATRPENPDESGDTRPCSTLPGSIPTRSAPESGRGTSTNGGSGIRTGGD